MSWAESVHCTKYATRTASIGGPIGSGTANSGQSSWQIGLVHCTARHTRKFPCVGRIPAAVERGSGVAFRVNRTDDKVQSAFQTFRFDSCEHHPPPHATLRGLSCTSSRSGSPPSTVSDQPEPGDNVHLFQLRQPFCYWNLFVTPQPPLFRGEAGRIITVLVFLSKIGTSQNVSAAMPFSPRSSVF